MRRRVANPKKKETDGTLFFLTAKPTQSRSLDRRFDLVFNLEHVESVCGFGIQNYVCMTLCVSQRKFRVDRQAIHWL
jgi:hypothetical protein